jgi:hypothetical protein
MGRGLNPMGPAERAVPAVQQLPLISEVQAGAGAAAVPFKLLTATGPMVVTVATETPQPQRRGGPGRPRRQILARGAVPAVRAVALARRQGLVASGARAAPALFSSDIWPIIPNGKLCQTIILHTSTVC